MTNSKPAVSRSKLYMSVGAIRGQYQPSVDVFSKGVLLSEDGTQFPAILYPKLEHLLQQQPSLLTQQQIFGVWPCTSTESPELFLKLKSIRKTESEQAYAQAIADIDKFSICGIIVSQNQEAEQVVIQIKRNGKIPQGLVKDPAWQPFNLEIVGKLPDEAVGQFWELTCHRQGDELVISQANLFVDFPSAAKKSLVDATNAATKSAAVAPTPEARITDNLSPIEPNSDPSPTTGKMEVVVKLNQFPDDVRTVDKGWLEFVVDTGEVMVTVTVKPKVFAVLEQAKLDYPDWVAAISGQMGEMTATGFRLESPAIKVFERKAKETSPSEPTPQPANSEPSSATSIQPSPLGEMQKKQTVALPLSDPQKTPPAVANPMQRPKEHLQQQRPSKALPHRGQKQQPDDNVPPEGKQLSRDPKSLLGSQTTGAAQNSQQSQKPRFTVTIDGRVFSGFDSVTLNRRMVCIDGKLVGQAKMVVVFGQPRTMQADGEVRQGRNQAVLTSK